MKPVIFAVILIIVIILIVVIVICTTPTTDKFIGVPDAGYLIAQWHNADLGMIHVGNPRDNIRIIAPLVKSIHVSDLWEAAKKNELKGNVDVLSHGAGAAFSETILMRSLIDAGLKVRNWYMVDPWLKDNKQMWNRLVGIVYEYTGVKPQYFKNWEDFDSSTTLDIPLVGVTVHARDEVMGGDNERIMNNILNHLVAKVSLSIAGYNNLAVTFTYGGEVIVKRGQNHMNEVQIG
jgi:hypothetical protein